MAKFIEIAGRRIGKDYDPVVIAEMGINPGGSLEVAKAMVDSAYEAGIEIIKHQTHIPEEDVKIGNLEEKHFYDDAEKNAFSEEEERELKAYVEAKGMIFISAPFSFEAVDRLEKMNIAAYKITSSEMDNYPLVEYVASKRKPIILSTGMNNIEGVKKAVETIKQYHENFAIQHCTNIYPTKPEFIRLGAMKQLMEEFPNIPIGLSDHSLNNNACLAATAMGASLLERHFTDSMYRPGPDIICSMDPVALSELIQGSKEIFKMRGGEKKPLEEEQVTIDFAYATVVAIRDIKKNEKFSEKNIWVKRPGTGEILAEHFEDCIGQTANRDISQGQHLNKNDVQI